MLILFISFIAGILTIFAPCILPLLPIILGTSEHSHGVRGVSKKSVVIITSLSVSVIIFTLLLKATTLLIDIPQSFWNYFSGTVIMLVAVAMIFPQIWSKISFVTKINQSSNRALGTGYQKKSFTGDILIGASLGPVFSTCSPTYLFIVATLLPASFTTGLLYLISFTIGLALALLLIAYFGQHLTAKISVRMGTALYLKQAFGILIFIVGLAVFTGYDKKFEAKILDSGYGATINLENNLIERFMDTPIESALDNPNVDIPQHLKSVFGKTDWSKTDARIERALSGGPGKDGIPSIDAPVFSPLHTFKHDDSVLAIVLKDVSSVKVYPYNILNWHEIVNDVVNNTPVAITFCPLCGSAVVYKSVLDGKATTFGVSGSLLESNMIMYDRRTESLWQQSTGVALAGKHYGAQLELVEFQLMSIADIRTQYPNAQILSEETGFSRNYARNPYVGYTESDQFIFSPSKKDTSYHPKEIMVVYRVGDIVAATPWKSLSNDETYVTTIEGASIHITKKDGEISITDGTKEKLPFYIEMWFSYAVQHGDSGHVFDPA